MDPNKTKEMDWASWDTCIHRAHSLRRRSEAIILDYIARIFNGLGQIKEELFFYPRLLTCKLNPRDRWHLICIRYRSRTCRKKRKKNPSISACVLWSCPCFVYSILLGVVVWLVWLLDLTELPGGCGGRGGSGFRSTSLRVRGPKTGCLEGGF